MTVRPTSTLTLLTMVGASLLMAGAALAQTAAPSTGAQETPAQARARAATSSLNGGPAQSTMAPRPNAQPPLSGAERTQPARPVTPPLQAPSPTRAPASTTTRAPTPVVPVRPASPPAAASRPPSAAATAPAPQRAPARTPAPGTAPAATTSPPAAQATPGRPSVTLAPGQSRPAPIPMPLGYYVRGDKNCNQVWPGEGDLAWFTPTSFTIDFGGCEPGQFLQTGPNAWTEEQRCMTELGGDAGVYEVSYEVIGTGTVLRRAHLAIDDRIEQDLWAHCETADVPEQARFHR